MVQPSTKQISERARVFMLFAFFFCIITAFWTLKPLRTSSVVKALGPEYYPLVKQGSLVFIPLVMFFYFSMTCYLTRSRLIYLFTGIFIALTGLFWLLFLGEPSTWVKVGFFYYVDTYITVMVALFWTYVNSSFDAASAKKHFAFIGAGGIVGGILGASIAGSLSTILQNDIILVSGLFLFLIFPIVSWLERGREFEDVAQNPVCKSPGKSGWESYTEGIRMISGSRYLLSLLLIVGLYEVVSTVIDFQFNFSCDAAFDDAFSMASFQGNVFSVANTLSLIVMLGVAPIILRKFDIKVALMFLPGLLLLGSAAFLLFPLLWVITLTIGGEMSFAYSINQASREALWSPLGKVEKFKTKAFIDMFVFRFAKTLGSAVTLIYALVLVPKGVGTWVLMLLNLGLIGTWLVAVLNASRLFEQKQSN